MSLQEAIEKERERLRERLIELHGKKAELDSEIDAVNAELKAITAYENVRKPKERIRNTRAPRQTGMKQTIIDLLKTAPLNRASIIDALGVRGDKSKEQTVSNTLANLKKKDEVKLKDGMYSL